MDGRWYKDLFWQHLFTVLLVFLALAMLYGQTFSHDFVHFDDDRYVLNNSMVRAGLSFDGIAWAFTTLSVSNWHPLTWLSYMLDATLFGIEPGWFALHNALLHGLNSLLVYALLLRLGGNWWPAIIGALVFLVHPLHVESVAWIAERKDVLSGLFYLLGLLAYDQLRRMGGLGNYLLVLLCCALALLAKPMAVTFPIVLMLLDIGYYRRPVLVSVLDKWPLLLMCLAAGLVTVFAQGEGGAISTLEYRSVEQRLGTAVVAYFVYLKQFLVPVGLAAFYPMQDSHSLAELGPAIAVLGLVCLTAALCWNRYRLVSVGIGFYLVTLLPVIGLLQVGSQAHADRYMYLPSLGLLIAIAALPQMLGRQRQALVASVLALFVCLYSAICYWQISYWQDRQAVFHRILAVNGPIYMAYTSLSFDASESGQYELATDYAVTAREMDPERMRAYVALGDAALGQGDIAAAERYYLQAADKTIENPFLLNRLAVAWGEMGALKIAVESLERALAITPEYEPARKNLARYRARLAAARQS